MNSIYSTAIIAAAGQGKRMKLKTKKQFLMLKDKPILAHTLKKFEECSMINEIIVITNQDEIDYCKKEVIFKYQFKKVSRVISGGEERQYSIARGLDTINSKSNIVIIHDGARPFVKKEDIEKSIETAVIYEACVLGVKVKDTIKVTNNNGVIINTPKRSNLWSVQTPQTFKYKVIKEAYKKALENNYVGTDDSVLVEKFTNCSVKIIEGSYTNIKITTPEDLIFGRELLKKEKIKK